MKLKGFKEKFEGLCHVSQIRPGGGAGVRVDPKEYVKRGQAVSD